MDLVDICLSQIPDHTVLSDMQSTAIEYRLFKYTTKLADILDKKEVIYNEFVNHQRQYSRIMTSDHHTRLIDELQMLYFEIMAFRDDVLKDINAWTPFFSELNCIINKVILLPPYRSMYMREFQVFIDGALDSWNTYLTRFTHLNNEHMTADDLTLIEYLHQYGELIIRINKQLKEELDVSIDMQDLGKRMIENNKQYSELKTKEHYYVSRINKAQLLLNNNVAL